MLTFTAGSLHAKQCFAGHACAQDRIRNNTLDGTIGVEVDFSEA